MLVQCNYAAAGFTNTLATLVMSNVSAGVIWMIFIYFESTKNPSITKLILFVVRLVKGVACVASKTSFYVDHLAHLDLWSADPQ